MPFFRHRALVLLFAGLTLGFVLAEAQQTHAQMRKELVTYVTRGEAGQFLLKRSGRTIPTIVNEGRFPDVIDGEPYAKYVLYGEKIGLWEKDPLTERLHPHKIINRAEFLKMVAVIFELQLDMRYEYEDVNQYDWVAPYAGVAASYGLFYDPRDAKRLRSELPVTHEEASDALYAIFAKNPILRPVQRILIRKVLYDDTDNRRAQGEEPDRDVLHSFVTVTSRTQVLESLKSSKTAEISTSESIQAQVINAVNNERRKAGLQPLLPNKQLQSSAVKHAKDMATRDYFGHYTPEGKSFVDRIKESGYTDVDPITCGCKQVFTPEAGQDIRGETGQNYAIYSRDVCSCQPKFALGENLAKGQLTVEEVVRDWMNSEAHRVNILQPMFTEVGVGIFRNMWVQNFGMFQVVSQ